MTAQDLRKQYLGYRPNQLASVREDKSLLYEFISWPWEDDGKVFINARPIDEPTGMKTFEARKQISPIRWGHLRQRAYREGFNAGKRYCVREVQLTRKA